MSTDSLGLYDSASGETLLPIHVADVSAEFGEPAKLVYAQAERGALVQVQRGCARTHYFYNEPHGEKMIREDAGRWGMTPDALMALVRRHAI
jgi:hypothetical protein